MAASTADEEELEPEEPESDLALCSAEEDSLVEGHREEEEELEDQQEDSTGRSLDLSSQR